MSKWSADYNKATGAKINYQSIGSGGGIAQIKAGTVDFGSSDKPLSPRRTGAGRPGASSRRRSAAWCRSSTWRASSRPAEADRRRCWPTSSWARSPPGTTRPIAALNPGVTLPADKINVVHRSDGSGTTFNFVNYLSKVSPAVEGQGRRRHLGQLAGRRRRQGQRRRGGLREADQGLDRLRRAGLRRCRTRWRTRRCRTRPAIACSRTPESSPPRPPAPTGRTPRTSTW